MTIMTRGSEIKVAMYFNNLIDIPSIPEDVFVFNADIDLIISSRVIKLNSKEVRIDLVK